MINPKPKSMINSLGNQVRDGECAAPVDPLASHQPLIRLEGGSGNRAVVAVFHVGDARKAMQANLVAVANAAQKANRGSEFIVMTDMTSKFDYMPKFVQVSSAWLAKQLPDEH